MNELMSKKTNLNVINVLISKALIDSNINHDEFASVNNVLTLFVVGRVQILPDPQPPFP